METSLCNVPPSRNTTMGEITKDDLYELKDDILERVSAGFKPLYEGQRETNQHLRILNNRIGKVEAGQQVFDVRLGHIEAPPEGRGMGTKKTAGIIAAGGTGLGALVGKLGSVWGWW
jgi:hypothetical protein